MPFTIPHWKNNKMEIAFYKQLEEVFDFYILCDLAP